MIEVENLGKKYVIRHQSGMRYQSLRDLVANSIKTVPRRLFGRGGKSPGKEDFWAVHDVSFKINAGERVGIIGHNGAGKSTLLKLISRITEPSKGRLRLRGRVATLMEVGTGFHPELSGRENIYLNGAILGMRKSEIKRKFDAIVDFAEIEKFLDTPVKHYSSGMYVRLAFAVAAHLEPEILLVDEVLAVGDFSFQKKCLGKMEDVSKSEGRTILFVSHQMEAISKLCTRALLMEKNTLIADGPTNETIDLYLKRMKDFEMAPLSKRHDRSGTGRVRFTDTWIENAAGEKVKYIRVGEPLRIVATFETAPGESVSCLDFAAALRSMLNVQITDLSSMMAGQVFEGKAPGKGRVECLVHSFPLNQGTYTYNLQICSNGVCSEDYIINAGSFDVIAADYFGSGKIPPADYIFLFKQQWSMREI